MITISRQRWFVPAALGLVVLAGLFAVAAFLFTTRDTVRPLTDDEAQRLAVARLGNYEAGTTRFHTTFASAGQTLDVHGVADWKSHVGSAVVTTPGRTDNSANLLVQWNLGTVAVHPGGVANPGGAVAGDPPSPPQDGKWRPRPLTRTGSDLDSVLALVLNMASDRPDNPQLLAQSGATYLRSDTLDDGTAVDVMTGPTARDGGASRVTYWLADDRIRRIEATVGRSDTPIRIDFTDAPGLTVAALPGLAGD